VATGLIGSERLAEKLTKVPSGTGRYVQNWSYFYNLLF